MDFGAYPHSMTSILYCRDRQIARVPPPGFEAPAMLQHLGDFAASDERVQLEPGDQVGLLLASANRCPRRFKNPDQFDPQRDDAGHLSLGAGIHFCVGAHLAKLELRIALQALFKRLPTLRLNGIAKYQNSYHFHGLEKLPVTWDA